MNRGSSDPKILLMKKLASRVYPGDIDDLVFKEDSHSYIINKKYIYLKVRKPSGEYYDDNTLIYVVLHELAHALIGSDHFDPTKDPHDDYFFKVFDGLLNKAAETGIYNPEKKFDNRYNVK